MSLAEEMQQAWRERGDAARVDLAAAQRAPGLFKPEFVNQRVVDFNKAVAEYRRWS